MFGSKIFPVLLAVSLSFTSSGQKTDVGILRDSIEILKKDLKRVINNRYYTKYLEGENIVLKESLKFEKESKRFWVKMFIAQTTLIAGISIAKISDSWVPVMMCVGSIEVFLFMDRKVVFKKEQ